MGHSYHLASFNQKDKPTWQFVGGDEAVGTWTTMFTIVDRPEAHANSNLEKLAEGVKADYEAHGNRVLISQALFDPKGEAYHYLVVSFDERSKNRMQFSFVKIGLGRHNVYVAIYDVRVTDPTDYGSKARTFLHQRSAEIGTALGQMELPDIGKLPRTEF
jgi:hypothetical protein